MKSKKELEYKVYRSRWPFWVLPLLLLLIVGLFVFLTLDATGHFGCLIVCKNPQTIDKEIYAPKEDRNDKDFSRSEEKSDETDQGLIRDGIMMKVTGEVHFPKGKEPDSLPSPSFLEVTFEDVSLMDAPANVLGRQEIDLKDYKKGDKITYSIEVEKPSELHSFYDVSAILNVGWKQTKDAWIRKGDYHTDTSFSVKLEEKTGKYERDIELVRYD